MLAIGLEDFDSNIEVSRSVVTSTGEPIIQNIMPTDAFALLDENSKIDPMSVRQYEETVQIYGNTRHLKNFTVIPVKIISM